jgi:DNA-binding LacI/PurR family transcriptional regulator
VDGVVVMPSIDELEPYQLLTLRSVPTVAIDSRRVGPCFSDVTLMHEEGMKQAVAYLRDLGHRRIAFIGGTEGLLISDIREEAFSRALQAYGIPSRAEYMRKGNYRVDSGDSEMRKLMGLRQPPTAVIGINDMSALGALRAARSMSLSVPEDVSIVGFDGIELDQVVYPSLTTMNVSRKLLAKNCHSALEALRNTNAKHGEQLFVPVELMFRQSSGRAPLSRRK